MSTEFFFHLKLKLILHEHVMVLWTISATIVDIFELQSSIEKSIVDPDTHRETSLLVHMVYHCLLQSWIRYWTYRSKRLNSIGIRDDNCRLRCSRIQQLCPYLWSALYALYGSTTDVVHFTTRHMEQNIQGFTTCLKQI